MYRRFLNDNDYLGIITQDALTQLTRGNAGRFIQAEEAAEISIMEYLSENYQIEAELNKGKFIAEYNPAITYPVGTYIYFEGSIYEIIRSISGFKVPAGVDYWEEYTGTLEGKDITRYSQFATYYKGDTALHNQVPYICLHENGYKFSDIRIPMVAGWLRANHEDWLPVVYPLWQVVRYEGSFYTLISLDGFDNNINPLDSDNWGAIADYLPGYNRYELSPHEYIVYNGEVYFPEIDVNPDIPVIGTNLALSDPRNYNIKKHLLRLSLYELTKLIAPNNVSIVRIKDYEESMKWLSDAGKLRLNPQIPRKIGEDSKPVTDWQITTFQAEYDPYKNPWMT